jgi:hypothetical protein
MWLNEETQPWATYNQRYDRTSGRPALLVASSSFLRNMAGGSKDTADFATEIAFHAQAVATRLQAAAEGHDPCIVVVQGVLVGSIRRDGAGNINCKSSMSQRFSDISLCSMG